MRDEEFPVENIVIRKMETRDTEEISAIFNAIIQDQMDQDFKRLIKRHAQQEEDACFVAVLDGRVVGFLISYILTMGFGINKSAWIATLGVKPEIMGQGIGDSLARAVLKYYKSEGVTNVYTSVRWDSTDLLSFFKTLGFDRSNFINLCKVLE